MTKVKANASRKTIFSDSRAKCVENDPHRATFKGVKKQARGTVRMVFEDGRGEEIGQDGSPVSASGVKHLRSI